MSLKDVDLQGGLLAALASLVVALGGLIGLRGWSKVKTENAQDSRQSRYDDRVHRELEEVALKLSEAQQMLLAEREKTANLRRRIRDQAVALDNALEELAALNPKAVKDIQRWVRNSTFAAFDDMPTPPIPPRR